MNDPGHAYVPPERAEAATLPASVAAYLDGTGLLDKTQALRIATVQADGWPHAALLSAGDVLAMPSGAIRFMVFAPSATTANLLRDGRVAVTLSLDGGMRELRMTARPLLRAVPDTPLALFEAALVEARFHKAPYATVTSGVTFALHDAEAVLRRWQRQIETMRRAG